MTANVTEVINTRRIVTLILVVAVPLMAFSGTVAARHAENPDPNGDEENNALEQAKETFKEILPSGTVAIYDPTGATLVIKGVQSFDDYDTDGDGATLEEEWNRKTPDWLAPMFSGCQDKNLKCM